MSSKKLLLAASVAVLLNVSPALAASDTDLETIRAEIQTMRNAYESKITKMKDMYNNRINNIIRKKNENS